MVIEINLFDNRVTTRQRFFTLMNVTVVFLSAQKKNTTLPSQSIDSVDRKKCNLLSLHDVNTATIEI